MTTFAAEINAILKEQGWTKSSLARRLGVKQTTVVRWANGTRPRQEDTMRILLDKLREEIKA